MPSLPAMTVGEALGSIPLLIEVSLGERALQKCLASTGLPTDIADKNGSFVTETSIDRFLASAAQQADDDLFGLGLVPHLSVKDYGAWGDYVLQAPTLGQALTRATRIIHLHADQDGLNLRKGPTSSKLEYSFAERRGPGYRQIALASLGPMLSIPRHYLGDAWLPISVDLDLGDKEPANTVEAVLETKVRTEQNCIAIEISNHELKAKAPFAPKAWTTTQDVKRACSGGPPMGLSQIVEHLVLQFLCIDGVALNDVAKSMAISRRTLQRPLDQEGTDFRKLVGSVKMRRATELLTCTPLTISEVGSQIGYSTAGHFARAFRTAFDVSPLEYRTAQNDPTA